MISKNKAWLLAARPKTLTGAAVPVMVSLSLAYYDNGGTLSWLPAILCLLFAFIMQIDANFVNDYFDYKNGIDTEERLGPKRACAEGWIKPEDMFKGIIITTAIACLIGFPLIFIGGWWTIAIGIACILFCFLYTTCLSRLGLGDLLVLVFFGLVPVCATYYLQRETLNKEIILASLACGLVIDTLLVINNFRDIDNDKKTNKKTLAVMLGRKATLQFYLMLAFLACLIGAIFLIEKRWCIFFFPLVYLFLHIKTYRKMKKIWSGRELNTILALTARNMFIYGILFSTGCLIDLWL